MKKIASVVFLMMILLGMHGMSSAETRVPQGVDVAAVFAQQTKQPFTSQEGRIVFLDTIWFYLSDNTFVQYAFIDNRPVVFSEGVYRFANGGSFFGGKEEENHGDLIITRKMKYVDKKGLETYHSERTYALDSLGFQKIFCRENEGKKVVAVFAGQNKQPYGQNNCIDTYWIFFDDNTFGQYACPASDPVPFSEGTYSLSAGADFRYEADETDFGKITIRWKKKLQSSMTYAAYDSEHTYGLNTLGFSLLVLDED